MDKEKLAKFLNNRQEEIDEEMERKRSDAKQEQQREEERGLTELRLQQEEHERHMWQEKIDAELQATNKRLELEKEACSTTATLPKLIITLFKGTPTNWVRFENMFITQVHNKSISTEEKFGYLLEMVNPNVRAKIANLKRGEIGYKIAWERLKSEYGQSKLVVNAHVEEIVNLPVIKGSNYLKIQELYESVSRNYDALLTMGEADMLRGFVMSTLNKIPQVRLNIVRTDENWEDWDMEALINNLWQWLKRHKVDDTPGDSGGVQPKRKKHWRSIGMIRKRETQSVSFCEGKHWGDACEVVNTIEARRQFFHEKK